MRGDLWLALLLLLSAALDSNSTSPPGKPVLLSCRSPEKETFTCWWEPGPDGGLPTTHRLYYETERLNGTQECPDYQSAGKNSCYFDKNHTAIWVEYYLTVVAFNDLGNTTSDPLKIDVMDIVKPDPPENVTLLVKDVEDNPHLHISWEPPHNTDAKSGWVTIKYEIRVKQGKNKWKEYKSGTQTHFSLYSISPGVEYTVQVRCRLDHSSWSEWSNSSDVKSPDYLHNERPFWIMASTFFIIPLSATLCILVMKRSYLKQYVLPPIPGPKIRGVDFQLLKNGPSDDMVNAFTQNFPLMVAWEDQMEDYLIVTENGSGLNRDSFISQERKNSWTLPNSFHFNSEIQCRESRPSLNDQKKAGKTKIENDYFDKSNKSLPQMSLSDTEQTKLQGPGLNLITEVKDHSNHRNTIIPFTNSDYVDIQRHEDNQHEEDVKQLQYSRVRDTNTDMNLALNKENVLFSLGYLDIQRQEENTSDGYSRVKEVEGDSVVILQKQMTSADPHYKDKANNYIACDFQKQGNVSGARNELSSAYVDATPASLLI